MTATGLDRLPQASQANGETMEDCVYRLLRDALLNGALEPGQPLSLRKVAAQIGTSPMPVREALKRLVAEGALEDGANRSVQVVKMTKARFEEASQMLAVLSEVMLETVMTGTISEDTLLDLETIVKAEKESIGTGDVGGFLTARRQFLRRAYQDWAAGSLLPVMDNLWLQLSPFLYQLLMEESALRMSDAGNLGKTLKALKKGDPKATLKFIRKATHGLTFDLVKGKDFQ